MAFVESAHLSFPLSQTALSRLSLTPEFDYPDPYNARVLSARLRPPLPAFRPAEIAAVGVLGKIYIHLFLRHIEQTSPAALEELDNLFSSVIGETGTNQVLSQFLDEFPSSAVYYAPEKVQDYFLDSEYPTARYGLYLSTFLVMLSNQNPALNDRDRVFSSRELNRSKSYQKLIKLILDYFKEQPQVGGSGKNIFDFLSEPFRRHPQSLTDQLEYIRLHWAGYLNEYFLFALLKVLDNIKEESSPRFLGQAFPQDPLQYAKASYQSDRDFVKFSTDQDWMPNLILLAKNIFVWLDQLSKHYQRPIHHLSHIPDEELKKLSSWGINGLWMIGLWERSSASQRIKQICGNIDAVPSAYSLYDYRIAEALGGEAAYEVLVNRAASYNIRLAADMVPNHMGVYSKWTVDHPDWFLSLDEPPFPGYSFKGENLSQDPNVSIFIEDHYYDTTDAAVTFKHVDHRTGIERHIYHGNDGTAMPWNDTAQIDFLNSEAREAVIEAILHVARKFPIIRFDAAMTLAKKHIQRLWFPEPGTGGAIPTRSEHGMPKSEFDQHMPKEFWREVVDRVAAEAPGTLLLAEAFWMMEGYFVRSLGMHRVYNSAFMHMLRDEKNAEYRSLIIETLEYDPQILKRYVNFMNNPDEETAIHQFGSDGKYFGTCVLMATLPGLPMLGHGQIEGFSEKYGMEYRRAYYDEQPNQHLIDRHIREIFPLLHKRYLFADVENFFLFDFTSEQGDIDQNVIAYSNRSGDESALILFHNKWSESSGNVHLTTPINGSTTTLASTLRISSGSKEFVLFRDAVTGLEYLISKSDLQESGLHFHLGAFHYMVLLDFQLADDPDGRLSYLTNQLNGKGTHSIQQSLAELKFDFLVEMITSLSDYLVVTSRSAPYEKRQFRSHFTSAIGEYVRTAQKETHRFSYLPPDDLLDPDLYFRLLKITGPDFAPNTEILQLIFASTITNSFHLPKEDYRSITGLLATKLVKNPEMDLEDWFVKDFLSAAPIVLDSIDSNSSLIDLISDCFINPGLIDFLQINTHDHKTWFNQEASLALLDLCYSFLIFFSEEPDKKLSIKLATDKKVICDHINASSYQVEKLLELLNKTKSHGTI